jgi:hypothetical protein
MSQVPFPALVERVLAKRVFGAKRAQLSSPTADTEACAGDQVPKFWPLNRNQDLEFPV